MVLLVHAASGCASRSPLVCEGVENCPGGHICQAGSCIRLCETDDVCSKGEFCDGTTCVAGLRVAPTLQQVEGNSAAKCAPQGTAERACIGSALVAKGQNLGGSSFILNPVDGGASIAMVPLAGGRSESQVVDLVTAVGAPTVGPGDYVLVASNSAGTHEAAISLLQGDRGDMGDRGPQGTQGVQGKEGVRGPVGPVGNGNAFLYTQECTDAGDDSGDVNCVTKKPVELSANRLVVVVQAGLKAGKTTTGQAVVDGFQLFDICGDADGCDVSMAAVGALPREKTTGAVVQAAWSGGTCHLFLADQPDPQNPGETMRTWTMAEDCTNIYVGHGVQGGGNSQPVKDYVRYLSHRFGVDGKDEPSAAGGADYGDGNKVLEYRKGCLLTTSPPAITGDLNGYLARDTELGFHVIAVGDDWFVDTEATQAKPSWTAAPHSCTLIVRD